MLTDLCRLARTQQHTRSRRRSRLRRARVRLSACALAVTLAGTLWTGAVTGAPAHSAGLGQAVGGDGPGISELRVQVMPEFDDPRVLIIVQGRLDVSDQDLPVEMTFPIPRGAQINQMAAMNISTGSIESQPFDAIPDPNAEQWTLVTYELTSAHFFYEYYYAPFSTADPARQFTFDFLTPHDVDGLQIEVQQPLKATEFSLAPPATLAQVDESFGFTYHLYEVGNLDAGGTVEIEIAYNKDTPEPSITREQLAGSQEQGGVGGPAGPGSTTTSNRDSQSLWLGLGVVGLVGAGAYAWTQAQKSSPSRKRAKPRSVKSRTPAPPTAPMNRGGDTGSDNAMNFCPKCGARLRKAAHFCHVCGKRISQEST